MLKLAAAVTDPAAHPEESPATHMPLSPLSPLGRFLDPKQKSLLRANLIVALSFGVALVLSDFPNNRANLFLLLPTLTAAVGTFDTIRNMRRRYSFYHAGVILCIYMDLMVLAMMVFFLIYPYSKFLTSSS